MPDRDRLEAVGRLSRALAWWFKAGFVSEPLTFARELRTRESLEVGNALEPVPVALFARKLRL